MLALLQYICAQNRTINIMWQKKCMSEAKVPS